MYKVFDYILLTIGSIIVAVGLELILAPNGLVDGGVTAISIMTNAMVNVPIWMTFIVLNIPSLIIAGKYMGKKFVVRTMYANVITSIALIYFAPFSPITTSEVLIVLYGGLLLGVGIGLVVKVGGAIDGTEMLAIWANKKYHIPISKFLLLINFVILSFAAFVFSLEQAMFSVAVFFIVSKVIDFILDGINQGKSVMIISEKPEEIGQKLNEDLGIAITYLSGKGGYSGEQMQLIYCITDRFIYPKLKETVLSVDKGAILEASFVTETTGIKRKSLLEQKK
ncbi:membrane protein [Halalkalibacter wakoensis JCM 9140]|uniref:Membrane protein n=1 Tax=Halalkalibacter wakoensis JCM 9140 TaxID=1236970 RepID=W4Q5Y2_9BACI|nr:YitT family protein [Halalkalibacter wakoensis]GAE27113.1 membrane protein [Halalkalibacter wakoensis JCM 9140]